MIWIIVITSTSAIHSWPTQVFQFVVIDIKLMSCPSRTPVLGPQHGWCRTANEVHAFILERDTDIFCVFQ